MATFLEVSKGTEKLLAQTEQILRKYDYQTAADNIRDHLQAFGQRELTVVVAGEARRGKSSLLNALLNEVDSVFPVDVNVCTNVVTILRYGETEKVEAYIEDPRSPQGVRIETIHRNQIADYVSEAGNPNNFKRVKLLKVSAPNELLKEGIVFVDTPGVGSLNVEHAEATYGFLPNADLLLFVTDSLSGMTESELDFLRRGYSYCKSVVFALTKKDLADNYEVFLEDNRAKISKALEIPADQVDIIPVSSNAKLRYLKSGRMSLYANSNFQQLEETIWSVIAKRRGEVLLLPYLAGAKDEIAKLLDSVVAQYQTLGSTVATDLVAELNTMVAKLDNLQEQGADWRNDLALTFNLLQTSMNAEQQTMAQNARDLIDERIRVQDKKICEPENYRRLLNDVNDLITRGLLDIRDRITEETDSKMAELHNALEMELGSNEDILSNLQFHPADLDIQFPKKTMGDKLVSKGRNITMNTMGGTAIGSILGGIVGFCIGGPAGIALGAELGGAAGTLFGGTKGCIESFSKYDQMDVNTVSKAFAKHVSSSMTGVASCVSTVLTQVRSAVTSSYEKQLKKRVKELQENIAKLKKNLSLAQNEIPKRQNELKTQIGQLNQIIQYYENVIRKITDEAPAPEQAEAPVKVLPAAEAISSEKPAKEAVPVEKTAPKAEDTGNEEVTYAWL